MRYRGVKGMSDILPEEIKNWHFVERCAETFFNQRLYEEIRTPLLESSELFSRSIGEGTDIVNKEMYSFVDRGGRNLTLRPEMTASVIRAVIENNLLAKREPLKLFYKGPMFRAERPQAGRRRQFYQIGVEVIGSDSPLYDAEVIKDLSLFLTSIGLTSSDFSIQLNSIGCPCCRPPYLEKIRNYFQTKKEKLCADCIVKLGKNVLRILDCKKDECVQCSKEAPRMLDSLCGACRDKFSCVKKGLHAFGIPYEINTGIVRGLDYYTGTVFEVTSEKLGAKDALAAGGRYDTLMKELGGADKGAIGFAIGMERLLQLFVQKTELVPSYVEKTVYIAYAFEQYQEFLQRIIGRLEQAQIPVYADFDSRSLKAQLRRAHKFGFRWVLILNEGEVEQGNVVLKDLCATQGEQVIIAVERLEEELKQKIV